VSFSISYDQNATAFQRRTRIRRSTTSDEDDDDSPLASADGDVEGATLADILEDLVECHLSTMETEGVIEDPFQDPSTHTLYLRVVLPEGPLAGVYYTRGSPLMVLDRYMGEYYEEGKSPDWIRTISNPVVIFHPRTFMVDIMAFLAMVDANKEISQRALHWCKFVSTLTFRHQFCQMPPGFERAKVFSR